MKAFKDNFLKATGLFFLYVVLAAFFLFEIYMVNNMMEENMRWCSYFAYFFLFVIFSSATYAFPLLAWFEESFKQILKNSVLIAVTNIPVTIMIAAITAGLSFLIYQLTVTTMSLMVFMGFSTIALFYSLFFKRIFERLGAKISFKDEQKDTDK